MKVSQEILDLLKSKRIDKNLTQEELAKKVGYNHSIFITHVEKGRIKIPQDKLEKYCKILGINPFDLMKEYYPELSKLYAETASLVNVSNELLNELKNRMIPVFSAQAGVFKEWTDQDYPTGTSDQYTDYSGKDKNAFGVRVVGDSMTPEIREGDIAIVEPNQEIKNSDYVFCRCDHSVCVKMYYRYDNKIVLRSINTAYPEIILTEKDCFKCLKVVEIRRKM